MMNHNLLLEITELFAPSDFFGFNKSLELQYRGRIDSRTMNNNTDIKRELFIAMKLVAETNKGPIEQNNSFGCSIKWKND